MVFFTSIQPTHVWRQSIPNHCI
jgi:predicted Abi (CAAX) family protease